MSWPWLIFFLLCNIRGTVEECVDTISKGDSCPSRHFICHHEYFRTNCKKTCFECGGRHEIRAFISRGQPETALSAPTVASSMADGPFQKFSLVRPALNGRVDCVSFMSVEFLDFYLQHRHDVILLQPYLTDEKYKQDTSFKIVPNKYVQGYVAIEAASKPGFFVRMDAGLAILQKEDEANTQFKQDASFLMAAIARASKISPKQLPDYFWHVAGNKVSIQKTLASSIYRIVPSLTGDPGTISFISEKKYIRRRGNQMFVESPSLNPSTAFIADASFIVHDSDFFNGYVSYEFISNAEEYLINENSELVVQRDDKTVIFQESASFKVEEII